MSQLSASNGTDFRSMSVADSDSKPNPMTLAFQTLFVPRL